jgi:hypothetical protein
MKVLNMCRWSLCWLALMALPVHTVLAATPAVSPASMLAAGQAKPAITATVYNCIKHIESYIFLCRNI